MEAAEDVVSKLGCEETASGGSSRRCCHQAWMRRTVVEVPGDIASKLG